MAFKLVMFSDFICPFCYIGFATARRLQPEFGFELVWRGFQIHPDWPDAGMPAERFYGQMPEERRRNAWARIQSMADDIGIKMNPPALLTNSRLALEAAEFAHDNGCGEALDEGVYRAYFEGGLNIADVDLLGSLGADAGLDRKALEDALATGKYSLRLKDNAVSAREYGVDGVPTFFIGQFPLVGAQGEDVMRQVLRRASQRLAQIGAEAD